VIAFLAFPKIAEAAYRIRHAILTKESPKILQVLVEHKPALQVLLRSLHRRFYGWPEETTKAFW